MKGKSLIHVHKCDCPLIDLVCDILGAEPQQPTPQFQARAWSSLGWKFSEGWGLSLMPTVFPLVSHWGVLNIWQWTRQCSTTSSLVSLKGLKLSSASRSVPWSQIDLEFSVCDVSLGRLTLCLICRVVVESVIKYFKRLAAAAAAVVIILLVLEAYVSWLIICYPAVVSSCGFGNCVVVGWGLLLFFKAKEVLFGIHSEG